MTVGFVISQELGGITADDELVAAALADYHLDVRAVAWDGNDAIAGFKALVLRSPWNYHLNPQAFLDWVDRAANTTAMFNDPKTVRWNAHKGYLFDLQLAGIPIIETVLCAMREPADLGAIMNERGWQKAIIKPAISASSYMTGVVGLGSMEQGRQLLDSILRTRDALIQPFLPEVHDRGERCLIFIDGAFSHAVQKTAFTDVGGGGEPVVAEAQEIEIGRRALDTLAQAPLYARVDLLRDGAGVDRLMELELIDPELYLRFDSESPRRFASALRRKL